jgi:hypothetical protein
MTGQIPKYGKHFRLESHLLWDCYFAARQYVLKSNPCYMIRSDHGSKAWFVFYNGAVLNISTPHRTLTAAMQYLSS